MGIMIKHTLKSIWAHKLRTLMLLFCISVTSLAAMLCFDMTGGIREALRSTLSVVIGSTDLIVSSDAPLTEDSFKDLPEHTTLMVPTKSATFYRHVEDTYAYIHIDNLMVYGLSLDKAKSMGLFPESIDLNEKEVTVSKTFADKYGYKTGDTIILHDDLDEEVEYTVAAVCSVRDGGMFTTGQSIVVNTEGLLRLDADGTLENNIAYLDIHEDSQAKAAARTLEKSLPDAEIDDLFNDEQTEEEIAQITNVFLILFVVCMLLVVFVTVSSSQRIIVEKMPVIGTFRSLGISAAKTRFILIAENAFYGLVGSAVGVSFYGLIKPIFYDTVFTAQTADGELITPEYGPVPMWLYAAVILGAVLLEVLCPLKEMILAVKTPIRDVILSNKDTEYRPSRPGTIAGLILAVFAAVTFICDLGFMAQLLGFAALVAAGALLFPWVLRALSRLLSKLFDKLGWPVARLAALEVGSKKSTVGSATLCLTAAALAMMLYILGTGLASIISGSRYGADVIIQTDGYTKNEVFAYFEDLEEVSSREDMYLSFIQFETTVNGHGANDNIIVFGLPDGGWQTMGDFTELHATLQKDQVVIGEAIAETYGISEGDTIEVTFKADGFLPQTRTMTVMGINKDNKFDTSGFHLFIQEKQFIDIFQDMPSIITLKSSDPEKTRDTIRAHSGSHLENVWTAEEYEAQTEADNKQVTGIVVGLILLGVSVTLIGVVSTQLIGFEGRRRECAVIMSTSLSRGRLSLMFILESLISSGIAICSALPVSILLSRIFESLMKQQRVYLPHSIPLSAMLTFALALWLIFALMSLFPIRAMKRMNIAEQLKYE